MGTTLPTLEHDDRNADDAVLAAYVNTTMVVLERLREMRPFLGDDRLEMMNAVIGELAAVWRMKPGFFRNEQHFISCGIRTARLRAIDLARKRVLDRKHMVGEGQIDFLSLTTGSSEDELLAKIDLEPALARLPPRCREVLGLAMEEQTNGEIAEQLGISLSAVKQQKTLARKRLSGWLDRRTRRTEKP